ncbi:hypothetical protein SCOCK_660006 [Actinacidiphila cocklensis]|uniref:Uncharacterized protein n=1 Tax=Actinacidiphila cocklensis TaxID=887465 RepID=A0A9W4GVR0_9ACTN|nr:hypothetical protein SCOCK_660006 [Actinacidiphila cocklensis]
MARLAVPPSELRLGVPPAPLMACPLHRKGQPPTDGAAAEMGAHSRRRHPHGVTVSFKTGRGPRP